MSRQQWRQTAEGTSGSPRLLFPTYKRTIGVPDAVRNRLDFLEEIVELYGHFLWHWLRHHPGESFEDALRWRTYAIGRMPFFEGGPPSNDDFATREWVELEHSAKQLFVKSLTDPDASHFARSFLEVFEGQIEEKARTEAPTLGPPRWSESCFSFGPDSRAEGRVFIHITNPLRPKSILDEPEYLRAQFAQLITSAAEEVEATSFGTSTWMNSYPRWLNLLPETWFGNLGEPDRHVTLGDEFWGQFVNAKGQISQKRAKLMRTNGLFPYLTRYSWCSFEDIRRMWFHS